MSGQIQLEGPDGCGKSTLIEHAGLDVPVVTYTTTQKRAVVSGGNWMTWIFYRSRVENGPALYDRFYPSQVVYPRVFNREGLSPEQHWAVEGWSLAKGGAVVLCLPPLEVIWENVRKTTHEVADNDTVVERSAQIRDEFLGYAERANLPVMLYDYTSGHEQAMIDWMKQHLLAARSVDGGTGIGNPSANLILVADQRRPDVSLWADLPFASAVKMSSGVYLRQALENAQISIRDVYITNSYEPHREITLMEELEQVGERDLWDVVALGNLASERLTQLGVEHRKVPHPQHWRRFHFSQLEEYGKEIRGDGARAAL